MSDHRYGKAIFGGLVGAALGVFVGAHRIAELAAEQGEAAPPSGWAPSYYMHHPRFWIVVIICTLVFGFISGRIGRPTSQSDL
jgi:prolipoprotein diacylglyceryltransferase